MGKCTKKSCGDYNAKSKIVQKYTNEVLNLKNRGNLGNMSIRQRKVYDVYITLLNEAPRNYTMRDVQLLQMSIEHIMECNCTEEDSNKSYRFVFDKLRLKISELLDEEYEEQQKLLSEHFCWNGTVNPHFCENSEICYRKTVTFGLMNDDFSWKTTNLVAISYWIQCFSNKFGFGKQWKWAEDIWGLVNLKQYVKRIDDAVNKEDKDKVDAIFDI